MSNSFLSFSQRNGLEPVKNVLQVDSMDIGLRNRLWNALKLYYFDNFTKDNSRVADSPLETLFLRLWHNYLRETLDTLPEYTEQAYEAIKTLYFSSKWNEVYDLIEFIIRNIPEHYDITKFINLCNTILEQDMSAFRIIDKTITKITDEHEIKTIEDAVQNTTTTIKIHLLNSLEKLSDRTNPDYRNSIKESISAVECICKKIVKEDDDTLGKALKKINEKIELPKTLQNAFEKLYTYTNDKKTGIRHALMDESKLNFDEAKFMLVTCSAFVNYLLSKAAKASIKIN
jgi:hypothetical protein